MNYNSLFYFTNVVGIPLSNFYSQTSYMRFYKPNLKKSLKNYNLFNENCFI